MKKVIITGATSFIGAAFTRRLLADGVKVYGVGRNVEVLEQHKKYGDFVPIVAGFDQYDRLCEQIPERDFNMFWHFAWQGTSNLYRNNYDVQVVNIKATCEAANLAVQLRCEKSFFIGTHLQCALDDEDCGFSTVIYGAVKNCASDLFRAILCQNGMPCVAAILPNTYGADDKLDTAAVLFIKNLLDDKPLNLISGEYPEDWVYIDDILDGLRCMERTTRKYGDYFIGHRKITTFKEKLITMKELLGSDSELNFGKYPESYHIDYSKLDLDALYNDTGFEPKIDFKEGILRTVEWLKRLDKR